MAEKRHIVITGSTRGIGFGLAQAFLEQGCTVTISGRSQAGVDAALAKLGSSPPDGCLQGLVCDVRQPEALQALWDAAQARFGKVDIWINNAGASGPQALVWELPAEEIQQVIDTNVAGVIFGCQVAVRGMLAQGFGGIYNMEGMGSDGRKHNGLTAYGMTKYALRYFNESLANEARSLSKSPPELVIGALRPGMVATEFLTGQYKDRPEEWQRAKRIFNMLAERVEVVAPWLAARILANTRSGVRISYTNPMRLMGRMLSAMLGRRDIFNEGEF